MDDLTDIEQVVFLSAKEEGRSDDELLELASKKRKALIFRAKS